MPVTAIMIAVYDGTKDSPRLAGANPGMPDIGGPPSGQVTNARNYVAFSFVGAWDQGDAVSLDQDGEEVDRVALGGPKHELFWQVNPKDNGPHTVAGRFVAADGTVIHGAPLTLTVAR